jgi:hypothetical protein
VNRIVDPPGSIVQVDVVIRIRRIDPEGSFHSGCLIHFVLWLVHPDRPDIKKPGTHKSPGSFASNGRVLGFSLRLRIPARIGFAPPWRLSLPGWRPCSEAELSMDAILKNYPEVWHSGHGGQWVSVS